MRYFVYILILCKSFSTIAQSNYENYFKLLNRANCIKNSDSILKLELTAIKYGKPFPSDLISISFDFYQRKKYKHAKIYFYKAVEFGYQLEPDSILMKKKFTINYNFGQIESYASSKSEFATFIKNFYSSNKKQLKLLRKKFLSTNDVFQNDVYEVLLQNEYNFQKIRSSYLDNKVLNDSVKKILYKYLNVGNSYAMLELMQNNMFPSRLRCARFNPQSINMLVNHAISSFVTKEDADKFVNLLWKEVEKGNITPNDYGKAMDHYTHWYVDKNKTLLGTTTVANADFTSFQCLDVLYPDMLNELRRKYWLVDIEIFCTSTGFKLPKNYLKK